MPDEWSIPWEVTGGSLHPPSRTSLLAIWLAKEPEFIGIGNATEARIVAAFGDELHTILSGDNVDLLAPWIGETESRQLLSTYREWIAEATVSVWLESYRFDKRLASKIVKFWGDSGIDRLRSNPYVMLTFAPWPQVDTAARSLGVSSLDPRRLTAAVEATLYDRLAEKDTHVEHPLLIRTVRDLLHVPEAIAEDAVRHAIDERAVAVDATGLQPMGAAIMEAYIAQRIELLCATAPSTLFRAAMGSVQLEIMLNDIEAAEQHSLTPEQRAGVRMALDHPVSILTGGAGVGKTNSIAWTAHFFADLHDANHKKIFDIVIVVSNRNVIDQQLQDAIFDFERTKGVMTSIKGEDGTKTKELAEALSGEKKIVVCTIQTFPAMHEKMRELVSHGTKRFAVIADEAHSSQTGEAATKHRGGVFAVSLGHVHS